VLERVSVAVVAAPDGFHLVDSAGVVFHTVAARPAGTPLLRVATPGPSDASTRAGLRVLAALTPALRQVLAAVVAETPNRIRLELTTGTVVVWGDADQSETKAAVATALLPRKPTTIDVTAPDVATTS
jgi:cell division protein FtsQ